MSKNETKKITSIGGSALIEGIMMRGPKKSTVAVRTADGGTHDIGFKSAFTKVFNDYARKTGLLKEKDSNLDGKDIREGLTAVISLAITEDLLEFEGQTKGKLGTP